MALNASSPSLIWYFIALTMTSQSLVRGALSALSQQVVVMVMMGLELMINGVLLAAAAFWWFLAPDPSGQVLLLVGVHPL